MVVTSSFPSAWHPLRIVPRIVRQISEGGQRRGCGLLLLTAGLLAGCDAGDSVPVTEVPFRSECDRAEETALELHTAIWHRLAIMPAVAQIKFVNGRPITDREREELMVEEFRNQAHARGILPDFAERVIRAQIAASKQVQTELYEQWAKAPPSNDEQLRDLAADLRPSIDAVNERILIAMQLLGGCPNDAARVIELAYARRSPLPPQVPEIAWDTAWESLRAAPPNFTPGRAALGRAPSLRSTLPENQPLLPDFTPEEELLTPEPDSVEAR